MAAHNSVLAAKGWKAVTKASLLVGKVTFGKTLFRLLIHQRWLYIDYMSLFWELLHS